MQLLFGVMIFTFLSVDTYQAVHGEYEISMSSGTSDVEIGAAYAFILKSNLAHAYILVKY